MQKLLLPARPEEVIDKVWLRTVITARVPLSHRDPVLPDRDFEYRIYVYNTVAELFCGDPVDSLTISGDNDPEWLPSSYAWERS